MKREEILANIREIIGNKKFTFSETYIERCKGTPTIGDEERRYYAITKKYLFIECWGRYVYSEEKNESGWKFERYPIFYRVVSGQNIKKVELEDMFTDDLEKILSDLKFYYWWEGYFRFNKVAQEYQEVLKFKEKYEKLLKTSLYSV